METCLLCLELQNNEVESITVNSLRWQKLNIQNVIEKHFWPVKTIHQSSWLCIKCWVQLDEFHKFYIRIEDAHMHFASVLKIEITNEIETSMQITATPEAIKEEQKAIIKLEGKKDLWDDDTPLIQLSKHKIKDIIESETIIRDPLKNNRKRKSKSINFNKTIQGICHKNTTDSKKDPTDKSQSEPLPDLSRIQKITKDPNGHSNNRVDKFITNNFKLTCILCQNPAQTFRDLCHHFESEHQQPGYAICCNKKFFQRNFLSDHLHQHLDPDYLKCKDCGKIFSNSYRLAHHIKTHDINRERKFCCDICGTRFVDRLSLNNHITRHLPEEEKLFPCLKCNKRFGNKWKLYGHVRESHESTTNCDICGLILVNKSALNIHKRIKHPVDDDKKEYNCSICLKTYPNQYSLKCHTKFVHQTGYIHKCTMCTKAFKKRRSLEGHMASHSGTALYTCSWCPKTFNCNSNFTRHRKKWHPEQEENLKKIAEG